MNRNSTQPENLTDDLGNPVSDPVYPVDGKNFEHDEQRARFIAHVSDVLRDEIWERVCAAQHVNYIRVYFYDPDGEEQAIKFVENFETELKSKLLTAEGQAGIMYDYMHSDQTGEC